MKMGSAIALLLTGGFAGFLLTGTLEGTPPDPPGAVVPGVVQASLQDQSPNDISASRQTAITRAVAAVSPAVVGINIISLRQFRRWSPWGDDPFFRQFFGDRVYTQQVQSLGSGFLISSDGYILTNDHVAGNAKEITVTMTNGHKYEAEIVGTDPVSDVTLLKIDDTGLPYLHLGDSDDVIIGEWVIAFGNPFGLFDISDKPTVTVGVVSATDMNIRTQEEKVYRKMIQTDAAINSGNSGGPLVNSLGEVIGVNSVIYTPNSGSVGVGFSIPINQVKLIMEELKQTGKVDRSFFTGLEVQAVDARIARYFGLQTADGVIVSDVQSGSPGERGGFKPGDIILKVDGERVDSGLALTSILATVKQGTSVAVTVWRNREIIELSLRAERGPSGR
ncbi:MAG: trypsin-like peptidase domain-containing protein [Ignavibacteria bacterium]|nr:trypsin-like peptidase domain-containing protein [Ignavibacteria bacterium]